MMVFQAINSDSSYPLGYKKRYATLHDMRRFKEASADLHDMSDKLLYFDDPEIRGNDPSDQFDYERLIVFDRATHKLLRDSESDR